MVVVVMVVVVMRWRPYFKSGDRSPALAVLFQFTRETHFEGHWSKGKGGRVGADGGEEGLRNRAK